MRHRVHGRKLGRTSAHRKALFRNQLSALFTHERIVTTLAKAKELRPIAEKMVTLARTGTLSARRKVLTMVPDKEIVTHLFDEIAPRFVGREGGYTRIMRLGRRRGDGAELAIIEFVDYEPKAKGAGDGDKKSSFMDRAKGMFGGGAKAEGADEEATAAGDEPETEEAESEEAEAVEAEAVEAEKPEAEKPKKAKKTKKATKAKKEEEPVVEAAEPAEEEVAEEKAAPAEEAQPEAAAEEEAPAEAEEPAEEPVEEEKKDE